MTKRIALFVACLFSMVSMAMAQSRVTGTVTSADDGQPVVGASVMVKGTTVGTITDIDGNFSLTGVPSSAKTLVVSFVGMKTQEVAIKANVKVALVTDAEMLDDVIVVAYGTAKKSSFTGSASNVDSKKLELRPITNVSKGVEGQVTGVLTTSGSGQPGSGSSIIIRGYGSINAYSDPLYVVDGIPYDGSLSSINPADIESMTILKDASAGALYGARGANGVVMITTKQGKEGKTNVNWRSTVGWSTRALKPYDMVDGHDYVQLTYEALRNSYIFKNGYAWDDAAAQARADLSGTLGGERYNPYKSYTWDNMIDPATEQVRRDATPAWDENWLDQLLRTGFRHEHQLSLNGGTEKTRYMFSLGYLSEDGVLMSTAYQRYNARVSVDSNVTDWFKTNVNVALSNTASDFSNYSGTSTSNPWYTAQFISPLFPLYVKDMSGKNLLDANGKPQLDYGEKGEFENARAGSYNDFNPLGGLLDDKAKSVNDVASIRTGMVFGGDTDKFGVFKGLKLALNFGADYNSNKSSSYMNMYHGNQANAGGLLSKSNGRTLSYTFNQLLTWTRSFNQKHNVDLLAGHEWYAYNYQYISAGKTNLVDGILELRPGTTLNDADSYSTDYRIESWMGRLNYNFDEKYYFSASLRTDGSSRFYKDNRWGTFWSLGANWRISKEKFMENVKWVDNLSFKASYGEQGNDNLGTFYAWQSLYGLGWNNANQIGGIASTLENKEVSWEKNGNFNIGIEGAFFNNRLRVNAEYYSKKTKDMLLNYPMALSTGFSGYDANVGDMRNSGFELELKVTPVRAKDFEWNVTWMGSTVKNKVLHLTAESPEIISGVRIIKEGYPINTFYMAKSAGVDPATGAQLYWAYDHMDENDNPVDEYITSDYSVATNHKYFQGNRIPSLYGSLGTDIAWKGFTLSVLTTYSIGGKVYDSNYGGSMNNMYYNNAFNSHALRRWQKPGDITDVPRIEVAGSYATTDRFLINASYFAIKNVTLGYSLPKKMMRAAKLNNVRLFGSVDNLALFTHLQGMDPQYNFSGSTDYAYTPNRSFSVGVEVNF